MQKEIVGQGRGDVNYNESNLLVRLFETKWESILLLKSETDKHKAHLDSDNWPQPP